jgi:hypothetical protein
MTCFTLNHTTTWSKIKHAGSLVALLQKWFVATPELFLETDQNITCSYKIGYRYCSNQAAPVNPFLGAAHPLSRPYKWAPFSRAAGGEPPLKMLFVQAAHPLSRPYKWRPFVGAAGGEPPLQIVLQGQLTPQPAPKNIFKNLGTFFLLLTPLFARRGAPPRAEKKKKEGAF